MDQEKLRILLVEDSPGDTRLLEEEMTDAGVTAFHVTYAARLAQALRAYEPGSFDVVLLDLTLPDSKGLDTVRRAVEGMPDVPILVLTTVDDDSLAVQAVAIGAQDYLVKGESEGYQTVRAMRYAIARHHAGVHRAPTAAGDGAASEPLRAGLRGASFGPAPLRDSLPGAFDELAQTYGDIVARTIDRTRGAEDTDVTGALVAFAERLGVLRAGPADVLEMHVSALSSRTLGGTSQRVAATSEQTFPLVLALMGHLASFYRRYSLSRQGGDAPGVAPSGGSDPPTRPR